MADKIIIDIPDREMYIGHAMIKSCCRRQMCLSFCPMHEEPGSRKRKLSDGGNRPSTGESPGSAFLLSETATGNVVTAADLAAVDEQSAEQVLEWALRAFSPRI